MMNRVSSKLLELLHSASSEIESSVVSFIKFIRIRYLVTDQEKQKKNVVAKGVVPTALVNRGQQIGGAINRTLGGGVVMNPINQVINAQAGAVNPMFHSRNIKRERKKSRSAGSSTSLRD